MAILDEQTKNAISDIVEEVIHDSTINTKVTYKQKRDYAYNPESQRQPSGIWKNFKNLDAIKGVFTQKDLVFAERTRIAGEENIEVGDLKFVIFANDIMGIPTTADLLVETKSQAKSGVTYEISSIMSDPFDFVFIFQCKRP